MAEALLLARAVLNQAEDRLARAELDWHVSPHSLERYAGYQAALAGLKRAAELYWEALKSAKISGGNSPGG